MKILFNTYPMAFHTPGGGEMQLRSYQRYLTKLGVNVELFNLWEPHFLSADIVHFFSLMGGSWHFCHFVKQLKLPLVITSGLWITEETKHLYPWQEIQQQLSYADKVVTNSQVESEQLANVFNFPLDKFAVVYNGVDPIFFEPSAPTLFREHFKIDYPFVLNVGNVEPRKNQLTLLKAMREHKDLKLVTIGHIRDENYAQQCREIGQDQFVFLGPLKHDDPLLRSAYQACEVFALPSTLETPGLAALEAAAQGAKLVVTGVGATREYFGEHAWYVDNPQDSGEIAEKLSEARRMDYSSVTTSLALKVKTNFEWSNVIKSLISVYHEFL
jgi:glycosyltransferase involved in cell wall biosynthesis